jgi:catechol 2,3-dioxygenase-like lactoylglutathione lyase family enzyme
MTSTSDDCISCLAVHSVDEFVFTVPDLAQARHFYASFGLDVRDEEGGLALYTFGHEHRWGRIFAGSGRKKLQWISFGIFLADAQRFESLFEELGVPRIEVPAGGNPDGVWFRGPDGVALQLRVAAKVSPSQPSPREFAPESENHGRSPSRSKAQPSRPLYLSHVLLFSSDVDEATRFYEEILGFRLSDKSGSVIAFLHSPHGSDHHLIAFAKSGGPGLHHISWCVSSIDAVGQGTQQMAQAGYGEGWGIGRHVLGSNYFRYVRDPWGSYAEYSFDIDYVEAGADWPSGDHPEEDSLYVWGPDVPNDFVVNYEI